MFGCSNAGHTFVGFMGAAQRTLPPTSDRCGPHRSGASGIFRRALPDDVAMVVVRDEKDVQVWNLGTI